MPATKSFYRYQPFLRACARFLVIGLLAYLVSLFVDGAFTLAELGRGGMVLALSGLILHRWRHLLTPGIGLATRRLEWRSSLGPWRALPFDTLDRVSVQREFDGFTEGRLLRLEGRDGVVTLRISHLEAANAFLEELESYLSAQGVPLHFPDTEGQVSGRLEH